MIRHPNNSGLQMDQLTRLYTPARYIDKLAVYQGDELVFSMEGGISISEDPNFRFTFKPNGAKDVPGRGRGHDGQDLFRRLARGPRRRLKAARASKAAHLRFGLRAPQVGEGVLRDGGAAENPADLAGRLAHRRDRLAGHIGVVGKERGDHVDRAGALLQRLARVSVRLHAGEDVVGARRGRVVVDRGALGRRVPAQPAATIAAILSFVRESLRMSRSLTFAR